MSERRWVCALLILALGAACGDDRGSEGGGGLLRAVEAEGIADMDEALVGTEGEVAIAVVRDGDELVAYLCDGYAGEWFTGAVGEELRSDEGTVLSLGDASAAVTPSDAEAYTIELEAADGDDDLVRFSLDGGAVGGLVVHDGVVRGSLTSTSATPTSPLVIRTTTTTRPPSTSRFRATVTIDLARLRTSIVFDSRCATARSDVTAAFDALERSLEATFARLNLEARNTIEDLERQIRENDALITALEEEADQLLAAAATTTAPTLVPQPGLTTTTARSTSVDQRIAEINQEVDELRERSNAIRAEIAALFAQIAALDRQKSDAIRQLRAQKEQTLNLVTRTCG